MNKIELFESVLQEAQGNWMIKDPNMKVVKQGLTMKQAYNMIRGQNGYTMGAIDAAGLSENSFNSKALNEVQAITYWDIRNADGSWRNLTIDTRKKGALQKAINFVQTQKTLSVGPHI